MILLSVAILLVVFCSFAVASSEVQAKGAGNGDGGGGVGGSSGGGRAGAQAGDDSGIAGAKAAGTTKGAVSHHSDPGRPVSASSIPTITLSFLVNDAEEYSGTEPATYTLSWTSSAQVNGCRAIGDTANGKWSSPGSGLYNLARSGSQTLAGVAAGTYRHGIKCRGQYAVQSERNRGREGSSALFNAILAFNPLNLLAQAGRGGGPEGAARRVAFTITSWVDVTVSSSGLETPSVFLEVSLLDEDSWSERVAIDPGAQVKLRWSSQHATRCLGTGFSTSGQTSRTEENIVEPSSGERRYAIRCFNGPTNHHPSATDFVTVSVLGGPEIWADPPLVNRCETTTIRWNVYELVGCSITGSDNQPFGPNVLENEGSAVSQPICGQFTYTLSCPSVGDNEVRVRPRIHIEEI